MLDFIYSLSLFGLRDKLKCGEVFVVLCFTAKGMLPHFYIILFYCKRYAALLFKKSSYPISYFKWLWEILRHM